MAQFIVPRQYQAGLAKLVQFDDDLQLKLLDALASEEPTVNFNRLIDRVAAKVDEVQQGEVDDVLRSVVGLYLRRTNYEGSTSDMIEGILRAPTLGIDEKNQEHYREYFGRLLGIVALDATAKALNLAVDNERVFYNARVLTDVRPVFVEDPVNNSSEEPYAAIATHTLKLSYYEGGDTKDFYVALDNEDVGTLQEVLERADAKAESVKAMLAPTHVRYLDPEEK
jgi:hypothetical protein